jgi:hypothetical protein
MKKTIILLAAVFNDLQSDAQVNLTAFAKRHPAIFTKFIKKDITLK